jgi:hypothetical protein
MYSTQSNLSWYLNAGAWACVSWCSKPTGRKAADGLGRRQMADPKAKKQKNERNASFRVVGQPSSVDISMHVFCVNVRPLQPLIRS